VHSLIGTVRRVLGACVIEDEKNLQKKNIFYLRCLIKQKSYSVTIDGRTCTNAISATYVELLGMDTIKHPKPYKL
jgi:hypothetical protein